MNIPLLLVLGTINMQYLTKPPTFEETGSINIWIGIMLVWIVTLAID